MAYNIDRWRTKRLDNFTIPVKAIQTAIEEWGEDWIEFVTDPFTGGTAMIGPSEGTSLTGVIEGEGFLVKEIEHYGEGSGHDLKHLERYLFSRSTGYLEAVLVWEGGDSISRLIVKEGAVSNEEVEL